MAHTSVFTFTILLMFIYSIVLLRFHLKSTHLLHLSAPTFQKPNPYNLFTNLEQANSFYLLPNTNLSIPPHVLLFLNSSIRHRPSTPYPPTLYPSLNLWSLLFLLLAGDVQLNPGPPMINFTHLNIHSLCNKSASLSNYLSSHPTDILSLNETWIQPDDSPNFASSLIPPRYSIIHTPRSTGQKGGGVAIVFRSFLKITRLATTLPTPKSFELMTTKLICGNKQFILINIYRPPSHTFINPITKEPVSKDLIQLFYEEFTSLLEHFISSPSELIITGDFNIHFDNPHASTKFSDILSSFDLHQHVSFPTNDHGHSIDLVITRSSSSLINNLSHHDTYLTDHEAVTFKFSSHDRPLTQRTTIHYRSTKNIDLDAFKHDILTSDLYTKPASTASDLADQFSSTLSTLLDKHAPTKTKTIIDRPPNPWINPDILEAKRERSRLERRWRHTHVSDDRSRFRLQCKFVRKLINKAKSMFFSNLVTESSANPHSLWKTLNSILHRTATNSLPDQPNTLTLANAFLEFFTDKIDRIRAKFTIPASPDPFELPPTPPPKLFNFQPASVSEIHDLIFSSSNKQCELDPIPTSLLKHCFTELGPVITKIVNLSLSEGIFPSIFKLAHVRPLLKKPSLPTDDFNNYRPISNLNFISKILEKVVSLRVQSHLSSNSLYLPFQSAYRSFHSTETALLKVHNDICSAMDKQKVTSLILLDLSAAFDTVDHSILLNRLSNWFGLDQTALNWFISYLSSRSQAVTISDTLSSFCHLTCGVPQGSVLGPLLFTLYTTPLGSVISKNSLDYHLYADDTQLYISFTGKTVTNSIAALSSTFSDILSWMNLNKLLLNPTKTEFLLIGTKSQRDKFTDLTSLTLGDTTIPVSSSARNLGFIFDSDMSLSKQINSVCKSCHFHIRDIRRIRHLLSPSILITLANSLVSSKLDYCNSLYNGINTTELNKLQVIQNSLARAITFTSKREHIKPVLQELHWLPIKQRIEFKTCLLTYKSLKNDQPIYLRKILSFPSHTIHTRSTNSNALFPHSATTSMGKKSFSVAAPRLWNSLPSDTRLAPSITTFRTKLKTHLFKQAFNLHPP
mgnify:FL=1